MQSNRKRILGLFFGVLVVGIFVFAVGVKQVVSLLLTADPLYLTLAFIAMICSIIARGLIWYFLFSLADVAVSVTRILTIYTVSLSAKLAIPIGYIALQPVIAYIISKDSYLETERVLSITTLGDMFTVIPYYTAGIIALVLLKFRGNLPGTYQSYFLISIGIIAILVGAFVVLWYRQEWIVNSTITLANWVEDNATDSWFSRIIIFEVEGLEDRVINMYEAITLIFEDPLEIFIVFVFSHLSVVTTAGVFLFTSMALGFELTFTVAVIIVVLSKAGILMPSPGGLGGVEAILIGGSVLLTSMTIPEATTVVLLYRFFTYWVVVIGGSNLSSIASFDLESDSQ